MSDQPSQYERMKALGASDAVIAAFDIMLDDGVPMERAATFAVEAERQGKDPEAFARHFVNLRKVAREFRP